LLLLLFIHKSLFVPTFTPFLSSEFTQSEMLATPQDPNLLQPLDDMYGERGIQITEITYAAFRREFFLYLMQIDDGTDRNFTLHDHIMSAADWLASPRSLDSQGAFRPQPQLRPSLS
jgi:hypothetical protein